MNPEMPSRDEKTAIGTMFDEIAFRYDFLNHLLSFSIDRYWRKKAIRIISRTHRNSRILDVATGTGEMAIAAMKLDPVSITGIDISGSMLDAGKEKVRKKGLSHKINLVQGDSENLQFLDGSFDVAMVAFGVRNFSDRLKGICEMFRVLSQNGMVMILEFSRPEWFPFRQMYFFYFRVLLPVIGKVLSKHNTAYRYLPDSVMKFPGNEQFMELMRKAGFFNVSSTRLTGGIACIYTGFKSPMQ